MKLPCEHSCHPYSDWCLQATVYDYIMSAKLDYNIILNTKNLTLVIFLYSSVIFGNNEDFLNSIITMCVQVESELDVQHATEWENYILP